MEDIAIAKKSIEELEDQKIAKTGEHRDTVIGLKEMGVNEKQIGNKKNEFNTTKRSETFNETLGPIEEEIKKMAEEISKRRKENDLHETPKEIYEKRLERLFAIKDSYVKEFIETTETGKMVKDKTRNTNYDGDSLAKVLGYNNNFVGRLDAIKFIKNIDKINNLISETNKNIQDTIYTEKI